MENFEIDEFFEIFEDRVSSVRDEKFIVEFASAVVNSTVAVEDFIDSGLSEAVADGGRSEG